MEYLIVGWMVCAIFSYGLWFAYWQGRWTELAHQDYWRDMAFSALLAILFGPSSLLVALVYTFPYRYGVKYF